MTTLYVFLDDGCSERGHQCLVLVRDFTSLLLLVSTVTRVFDKCPKIPNDIVIHVSDFLMFLLDSMILLYFRVCIYICLFSGERQEALGEMGTKCIVTTTRITFIIVSRFAR